MATKRATAITDPFPDPRSADEDGVVCQGAKPDPELLAIAYRKGIFPWPHRGIDLLWFSPDPRYLVLPAQVHVNRSLKKALRRSTLTIKADTAFAAVMDQCAAAKRPGQRGTWITRAMVDGYCALHAQGFAHSVEAWRDDVLVGGLYGVSFGAQFCGESMFALEDDASKVAFATLAAQLARWQFDFIDCQTHTEHTARFGTVPTARESYLKRLALAVAKPTRLAPWPITTTPQQAADMLTAPLPAPSVLTHSA